MTLFDEPIGPDIIGSWTTVMIGIGIVIMAAALVIVLVVSRRKG